jgi:hypothetical protein
MKAQLPVFDRSQMSRQHMIATADNMSDIESWYAFFDKCNLPSFGKRRSLTITPASWAFLNQPELADTATNA